VPLDMPLFRTLTPRHRRVLAGLIALAVMAVVCTAEFIRQRHEFLSLAAEIRDAGGAIYAGSPLYERLIARWSNSFPLDETMVGLDGDRIDGDWLRRHDNLNGLTIEVLYVGDCPLSGPEVALLIEQHPITFLSVGSIPNSDVIARALGTSKSLQGALFWDSDLTNSGFCLLPLEILERVDVPGTAVTSKGLKELRRCRKLEEIPIDGRQFDESVAKLICGQLQISKLSLRGKDVTDDHLARIYGMSLRSVVLRETSVTQQGIAALKKSLPKCQIRVYNRPESTE
jgi:hypothetical protein